jgi:hypothetical protein
MEMHANCDERVIETGALASYVSDVHLPVAYFVGTSLTAADCFHLRLELVHLELQIVQGLQKGASLFVVYAERSVTFLSSGRKERYFSKLHAIRRRLRRQVSCSAEHRPKAKVLVSRSSWRAVRT